MVSTHQQYTERLGEIVGDDIRDGVISLNLTWSNRDDAKALLGKLRGMQGDLRRLKQDVAATATSLRAEFTSRRADVGHSTGAVLASAFLGRRAVGAMNASQKEQLRRAQHEATQPYEKLKRTIDAVMLEVDKAKRTIEASDEYRLGTSGL